VAAWQVVTLDLVENVRQKKAPGSGLKRAGERAPTFQKWRIEFRRLTASRRSSTGALKRLGSRGCNLEVLEELLYTAAAATRETPMAVFKRTEKELSREIQSFLPEISRFVRKTRYLNANYVPDHWEGIGVRVVLNRHETDVPLEWFEYLPEILASYGQYLQRIADMSNSQTMDHHGPEATMLATYIKVKTGRAFYDDLFLLLEDACKCVGTQFQQSSEAIRKTLARYRKDHPKTYNAILESISNYESLPISGRLSLGAQIRSDLSHPRFMMDQYHKAGKISGAKLTH
jgi:hypothetical protein